MLTSFVIIGILTLANGLFAAAELALVAARKARLQAAADVGDARAVRALAVQEDPGNFLATVQVAITLIGTLAGAYGGAEVAGAISPLIREIPLLANYANQIALALVVVTIAYLSLVVGELVPKQLALQNPERLTLVVVGPLSVMSRILALPVRLLDLSAGALLRLLGSDRSAAQGTTPEEIEIMIKEAVASGTIQPVEERLITRIFDYTDLSVKDVMTPYTNVVALQIDSTPAKALETAERVGFSRFPVYGRDLDDILGYVHVKDLIWARNAANLRDYVRDVTFIPASVALPRAFTLLTKGGRHIAIVIDEFGGTDGIITLEDLLEVIVGEIEDEHSPRAARPQRETENVWVVAGSTPIAEVDDLLDLTLREEGSYATLAGFILSELGVIPSAGEQVSKAGFVFTVEQVDRYRIASVRVTREEA